MLDTWIITLEVQEQENSIIMLQSNDQKQFN